MQESVGEMNAMAPAKENKVSGEHPELHHYTTRSGLQGIQESQSLWASVFDVMNDPGEFMYAKGFYIDALASRIRTHLIDRRRVSLKFDRKLRSLGGNITTIARDQAKLLVETYYDVSMFTGTHRGEKVRFCLPHITSFCSHNQDKQYEQQHGLLSQWRGYADGGAGFAIVFDTLELENLIEMEQENFDYVSVSFFDVQYDEDPRGLKESFTRLVDMMADGCVASIDGEKFDVGEHFELFLNTATRLKHRAFFEEREVRIVVHPVFQEFRDYCVRHKIENAGKSLKRIEATPKPHVALFDGLKKRLPIRRLIVGPSKEQKDAADWLRRLVDNKIEVCLSETPFRAN